jgi:hypothetical protein
LHNTIEEMKNPSINSNSNQDPKRKRSNSFEDIIPKKEIPDSNKMD